MKTTMKQLAAGTFLALLLLVGNVQAEGTETKMASQAIETTLQVEKWMTSEDLWNTNMNVITEVALETESTLELESWMTSENTWSSKNSIVDEPEAGMALENWMTTSETWNTVNFTEDTETEITVENWMTSENIWNR